MELYSKKAVKDERTKKNGKLNTKEKKRKKKIKLLK